MGKQGLDDPHAESRERKRRKARYGMRVTGRSVRLLARLTTDPTKKRPIKKKKR